MENTIFGMDANFINTLSEDELNELQTAKNLVNKYKEKYTAFCGGTTTDDIKRHLSEVAAQQRSEAEACDRVRNRFK
jgi:hypothetical protein